MGEGDGEGEGSVTKRNYNSFDDIVLLYYCIIHGKGGQK